MTDIYGPIKFPDPETLIKEKDELIDALRQQMKDARESLHDSFAMTALAGLLANPNLTTDFDGYASDAYGYADAMLREREKRT